MVSFAGKAPVKYENSYFISGPNGPVKFAIPAYSVSPPSCRSGQLVVKAVGTATALSAGTELVEDINAIALKNLDDRMVGYIAKATVRVIAKQVAVAATNEIDDALVRAIAKMAALAVAAVSEVADTRSWQTLPGEIHMVRTFVPPGSYEVSARLCGSVQNLGQVELGEGETKFLLVDTMY
jgi:hypothetical protein